MGKELVADETTVYKFLHLMERPNLVGELFRLVNVYLDENGLTLNRGTTVDTTCSTKNKPRQRDSDMGSTQKGKQKNFGMKTHIVVDSRSKLIHSVLVTSLNVHDSQIIGYLLHSDDSLSYGDSAYTAQKSQIKEHATTARDFTQKRSFCNHRLTDKLSQTKRQNRRFASI
ncbi:transposase [Teredinibacter turnerae]|uniref:transposase n=2 Tax=Teredinibacter turnerae TaxID=2426 RepID=UPI0018AD481D|nr:transposase [Teredinibacter turnerae]